ncbi:MAG TPA: hypothetical protein P5526_05055 [Anaerolineae bacterium]|nr:hypothetical protein [Anaerolineae bacterium]HRV91509.1 hypothetical protein [Anaerolineae bacterium]
MQSTNRNYVFINKLGKMNLNERKVILELSEHDATLLLILIQNELNETDETWHNYWKRLAHQVRHSIERTGFQTRRNLDKSSGDPDH